MTIRAVYVIARRAESDYTCLTTKTQYLIDSPNTQWTDELTDDVMMFDQRSQAHAVIRERKLEKHHAHTERKLYEFLQ